MIDVIIGFWKGLPWVIRFVIEIIVIRKMIASEASDWLSEKKPFKGGLIHNTLRFILGLVINTERKVAIWLHYREAHQPKVRECTDGQCAVLA